MQPELAITIRKPPSEALAQLERVVIEGDLAVLSDAERIGYYARVCESLGLNPLTRPFEYIKLNNKLTLYARKDGTDQLRKINGVSIERLERERDEDLAIVTAYGHDRSGRTDSAIGAVSIKGLSGEGLANALMKAETKAKRRLTLSLAGLGWLDEIETETAVATAVSVDPTTGAIDEAPPNERASALRERITERTAAIRGEPTEPGEFDASIPPAGGAAADGASREASSAGSPGSARRRAGDPWMARLHALGVERGMDHDALHEFAAEHFQVTSLTELTPPQRATFMELLERTEAQPAEPPKPASDAYKALPPEARAEARAYWAEREREARQPAPMTPPEQEPLPIA